MGALSLHSGDRKFGVPENYPLNAAACGVDANGQRFIRVKGVRWFTNLDYPQRHEKLPLYKQYSPEKFPNYDNYDAINVNKTADIPYDYDGVMGVPITFMDKYNPEQFAIIWQASGNTRASAPKEILDSLGYHVHPDDRGGCGVVKGERVYGRIFIRHRKEEGKQS